MSDIVKLEKKDFKLVKELRKERDCSDCSILNLEKSFNHHLKNGLKYNKKTGVLSDKSGWLSKPSNKKDILKNPTREDVIEWEFLSSILNSCQKIKGGYKL